MMLVQVHITSSARRHGVEDEDMAHAWRNAIRYVEFEYDGEERLLIIGPDRSGRLLEHVAVPSASPTSLIHADRLRPRFHEYVR
jgi:hypothetical protein